jgi:hypothetical protein
MLELDDKLKYVSYYMGQGLIPTCHYDIDLVKKIKTEFALLPNYYTIVQALVIIINYN